MLSNRRLQRRRISLFDGLLGPDYGADHRRAPRHDLDLRQIEDPFLLRSDGRGQQLQVLQVSALGT
jgi:hypothetical protein